jgi:hypothetical protein
MAKKYKEVDVYVFDIKTDTSEMSIDTMTKDISQLKNELKDIYGYGNERIKSIKFRIKRKGMVRV